MRINLSQAIRYYNEGCHDVEYKYKNKSEWSKLTTGIAFFADADERFDFRIPDDMPLGLYDALAALAIGKEEIEILMPTHIDWQLLTKTLTVSFDILVNSKYRKAIKRNLSFQTFPRDRLWIRNAKGEDIVISVLTQDGVVAAGLLINWDNLRLNYKFVNSDGSTSPCEVK